MSDIIDKIDQKLTVFLADYITRLDEYPFPETLRLKLRRNFIKDILTILREPTQDMINAAGNTKGMQDVNGAIMYAAAHSYLLTPCREGDYPLHQAFRAMIDEILK